MADRDLNSDFEIGFWTNTYGKWVPNKSHQKDELTGLYESLTFKEKINGCNENCDCLFTGNTDEIASCKKECDQHFYNFFDRLVPFKGCMDKYCTEMDDKILCVKNKITEITECCMEHTESDISKDMINKFICYINDDYTPTPTPATAHVEKFQITNKKKGDRNYPTGIIWCGFGSLVIIVIIIIIKMKNNKYDI